jgi:FKBP-type peptidyl-prolyl cis-trans isomerase
MAVVAVLVFAGVMLAQDAAKKSTKASAKGSAKTTKPAQKKEDKLNTNAPTPTTGEPTTTKDGLKYWDIKAGTGPEATAGHRVKVNYAGWLTNGKLFDTSVGKTPFEFNLGGGEVIKGWDEGVQGMKVGGIRQLRIPPELGYGNRGAGGVIPPGATLVFDVQLLGVQ